MGIKPVAETLSKETLAKLREWSEKAGKTEAELTAETLANVEKLRGAPGLTAKDVENRARFLIYQKYVGAIRSPSKWYEGVFFGVSGRIDVTAGTRANAEKAKEKNFSQAVSDGLIDSDGVVLDTRQKLGTRENPNFGKEMKSFYQKIGIGIGRAVDGDGELKVQLLALRGANVEKDLPIGQPVKYRANERQGVSDPYKVVLNDYLRIEFVPTNIEELPTEYFDLFDAVPEALTTSLKDLRDWYDKNAKDNNRIVFVEADVLNISDEPNEKTGNYTIMLTDMNMGVEDNAIPMFITEDQYAGIDYVRGSRLAIIARPNPLGTTVCLVPLAFQPRLKMTEDYFSADEEIEIA